MRSRAALLVLLVWASSTSAGSAAANPDWPCVQPLVPTLTYGMMWSGPPPESVGDWRADPAAAALVARVMPRNVSTADGEAAIGQFLSTVAGDKTRELTRAFAGLLDETNGQRGEIIDRIKSLAERQHNLADLVTRLAAELNAMPQQGDADAMARRNELSDRLTYTSRTYTEVQRTIRYACEVPAQLDARLGAYARALAAALP